MGAMSMLSSAQSVRLNDAASSSVRCESATKVPAELTISQWALESGWGAHQPGNNCFGIKAYAGCYGVQRLQTVEVIAGVRTPLLANFATFPSLAACFDKHALLIAQDRAYAPAWQQYVKARDLPKFLRQIASVYATDPRYADDLLNVLAMPEVKDRLAACRKTS